MSESTWKVWDVKGSFIIPGTRDKASFSCRVGNVSRQEASKDLGGILNEKFAKKLRGDHKFNRDFAMVHLQWQEFNQRPVLQASTEKI